MKIRLARESDASALLNIYSQYINTSITFEYECPTQNEFLNRIKNISKDYPYLVCEKNGFVIGYAYASKHRLRAAYQWDVEVSIYLDKSYTSNGIGKMLYSILIDILKLQGIKNVYAGVTGANIKSEKFHSDFGFSPIGIYHKTGYKNGKWLDVVWFEKQISAYDDRPTDVLSIKDISQAKIQEIIKNIFNFLIQ